MKQVDIEKRLSELQAEDRTNPEIYNLLVRLVGNMIISQNWLLAPIDFDNVTHDIAADIFMKVYNGTYTVEYWRALAYRMMKFTYIKKQRQIAMTQTFDINNDPIKKEQIYRTCASCVNTSAKELAIAENKAYLEGIGGVIRECMDESKFCSDSPEYLNIYMSVCLSLLYGEDKFFHVEDSYKPFVHLISQNVKQKFSDSGFFDLSREYDVVTNPDFSSALMPDLEYLGLLDK